MIEFIRSHWVLGAMFCSASYTVLSVLWTWKAEQRLQSLKNEARILGHIVDHLSTKLADVENFLENGNTQREIKVPSVVYPLVVPRVNVPESTFPPAVVTPIADVLDKKRGA